MVGAQAEEQEAQEEAVTSHDLVGTVGSSVGHMASAAVETTQHLINKVPLLGQYIPIGARPAAGLSYFVLAPEPLLDSRLGPQRLCTFSEENSGSGGPSSTLR
jgi:hypothetical protein